MSRLGREFAVATRRGVALSAFLAFGAALLFALLVGKAPLAVRLALGAAMASFIFIYGFLVSYVHGDARRRGMRPGLWALVAALVPHALGFVAYFVMREPVLQQCGACGTTARRGFAYCPQCGSSLSAVCPGCQRVVEAAWIHCTHCGTKLQ